MRKFHFWQAQYEESFNWYQFLKRFFMLLLIVGILFLWDIFITSSKAKNVLVGHVITNKRHKERKCKVENLNGNWKNAISISGTKYKVKATVYSCFYCIHFLYISNSHILISIFKSWWSVVCCFFSLCFFMFLHILIMFSNFI